MILTLKMRQIIFLLMTNQSQIYDDENKGSNEEIGEKWRKKLDLTEPKSF